MSGRGFLVTMSKNRLSLCHSPLSHALCFNSIIQSSAGSCVDQCIMVSAFPQWEQQMPPALEQLGDRSDGAEPAFERFGAVSADAVAVPDAVMMMMMVIGSCNRFISASICVDFCGSRWGWGYCVGGVCQRASPTQCPPCPGTDCGSQLPDCLFIPTA